MLQWYRQKTNFGLHTDELYYRKDILEPFEWSQNVEVSLHGGLTPQRGSLYIPDSVSERPRFYDICHWSTYNPSEIVRFNTVIVNDQTVSENYQRLVYDTTAAVYDTANDGKTVGTLREELIGQVRLSMGRVFGDLLLNSIPRLP